MMNFVGILVSLLYIVLILQTSSFLVKKKKMDIESSRKFIHIGLCNWWLIAWIFFDNAFCAAIVPALFVLINLYSSKKKLIKVMEREEDKGLGTVWYSLALFILALVFFNDRNNLFIGALSVLILGYGDGLAGLLGMEYGKHKYKNGKTLEGSIIMFVVSFIISYFMFDSFILNHVLLYSFIVATFSMFIESIFSKGYDNLFIPIGISIITYYLLNESIFYVVAFVLAINIIVVTLAYGLSLLTIGGSIMALIIGFITYYYGGLYSYIALILFFTSCNVLEIFAKKKKNDEINKNIIKKVYFKIINIFKKEKDNKLIVPRNYKQVISNGLISSIFIIIYYITLNKIFLVGFFVSIAGATSDTWSSELGKIGKEKVKYILSKKEITKGLSGGVTKLGFLGGIIGSLIISLVSLLKFNIEISLLIFILGFMTTIVDSILGELFQGLYIDKNKNMFEVYNKKHKKIKGYKFMSNNMVNFISTLIISIIGILISIILV